MPISPAPAAFPFQSRSPSKTWIPATGLIFPYTLGANIGTTVTAMLASFATLNPVAITVAFTHLLFNTFGIVIIYPLKKIPIWLAESFAKLTAKSKKNKIFFLMLYFLFYLGPLIYILFVK